METYSTGFVRCPNCGENVFDEANGQALCFEPFNGAMVNCPRCGVELSLDMRVKVDYTSQPPTFKSSVDTESKK